MIIHITELAARCPNCGWWTGKIVKGNLEKASFTCQREQCRHDGKSWAKTPIKTPLRKNRDWKD